MNAICDIAVCPVPPYPILVASQVGQAHLLSDPTTATGTIWDCHGGTELRVGWAGQQPLAWNPGTSQVWVLLPDGRVVQHPLPSNADVAICDDGFFVSCPAT